MLYSIKQVGGLKACPMHVWLDLALGSLFYNQDCTSKAAKLPTINLLKVLKPFLQT